jgi:ADP-ribosylglycohydrolase
MALPTDYLERVYAGVLGKIIGVYLGRPFEGWGHAKILRELGEVWYYVHDRLGKELVVTDDDISGTFAFVRALEDCGKRHAITAADIGDAWLNYIIENKTILWWGGMGMSTEHTAFLRLKRGIKAPESGSSKLNGKVVAEQIGAQIFIDGWAMVAPGDPELAAELARKAASVSHDGEAICGAQVIAAMESLAFVERDLSKLLDVAVSFIPKESVIYRMITDLRAMRQREADWKVAFREVMQKSYGYDKYGGNCHMVPNHGIIILALLWGEDDFQKSLMIANTCGWDTDCNSGNVGCLLGIKNGLARIDAGPDWRGPVADRMYLPTADGGRAITDAATEAVHLVNMGRALAGEKSLALKEGVRFHFELPGSVQGFVAEGGATVENVEWNGSGKRALAIRYRHLAMGCPVRAGTAAFMSPAMAKQSAGYAMFASPTLYAGQKLRASLAADAGNRGAVTVRLFVRTYNAKDGLDILRGEGQRLEASGSAELAFVVPETGGFPVAEVGVELAGEGGAKGTVYLDYLRWDGEADVVLRRPEGESGTMYRRAWVGDVEMLARADADFVLMKNEGRGLTAIGTAEWRDYRVETRIVPHLARSFGLAARCRGLRRFYGLVIEASGVARLIRMAGAETVLARTEATFQLGEAYSLWMEARGNRIIAGIGDKLLFDITDNELEGGGAGLILEEGRMMVGPVRVRPIVNR